MRIFVAECANLSNRWAFREYHCGSMVVKTPPASNHIPKESDPLAYSRRRLKTKLMRLGLMTTWQQLMSNLKFKLRFTDSRVDDALRSCHLNVERAADELLNSMWSEKKHAQWLLKSYVQYIGNCRIYVQRYQYF